MLLLRGTNVSGDSKDPPDFVPNDFATAADFARLRDELGMNAVRYLIFWEAIEPERGVYDDAYLAEARRRVEEARAAGLHVIVDMHQDVYGRGFGFDGAPAWTCDQALYDSFDEDRPSEWYLGYTRAEVQTCFDRLYTDAEIRAAFAEAWRRAAEALSGVVLAYEVLNEPHWGRRPCAASSRRCCPPSTRSASRPSAAKTRTRSCCSSRPRPPTWACAPTSRRPIGRASSTRRTSIRPSSSRAPAGPARAPSSTRGSPGSRATPRAWAFRSGSPSSARARASTARRATCARSTTRSTRPRSRPCSGTRGAEATASSTPSSLRPEVALSVARPHPARTAGVPGTFSWDAEARVFTYAWDEDGSALGDTVITAPALLFPDGVQVEPPSAARVEGSLVIVPQAGGERSITLRPL
ncbi:MAG: cellulase family glycosylhydrolase [Sandaracinaceae bacterium]|nr:cellulase family glycosylhydrolase [Sandaracinaceae bacterium]